MKSYLFLFLFFLLGHIELKSQATYVDSLTGIIVSFVADEDVFPSSWVGGSTDGHAVSLDTSEYKRSKKLVSVALSKYPLKVLKKNLKKIYVLKHMDFYGVNYGGTNSTDAVYMTNQGLKKNYTDLYMEQTFHEEFSSILLRNYSAFIHENKWSECASDSISYSGTGADAIRNGKSSQRFDERINQNGFLGEYATSNFENDINSFAKNIFCPKDNFWDLIVQYDRLECKLEHIIRFYYQIHPDLNAAYFMQWRK